MNPEHCEYPTVFDLHAALSIYARESRAPFQNLRQSLREIVRRIYSDAPALEQELKEIQRRLGTTDERPEDMTRSCTVIWGTPFFMVAFSFFDSGTMPGNCW